MTTHPAPTHGTPTSSAPPDRREWPIITAIALCTCLAPINSTMIVVALPRMLRDLHSPLSSSALLITLYLVVMASLQPVAGKLGDRLGRRNLILGALVYFGLVSLGATVAPNLPILVFFRLQQAVAAAIALPNGTALIREVIPAERRASRFGIIGGITGSAAAVGPPLGGVLTQAAGWRAIFAVNMLFVIPALLIGWRVFPRLRQIRAQRPFDLLGACLLFISLAATSGLLIFAPRIDILTIVLGIVVLTVVVILFIRHEYRHPDPVLQPRLFAIRTFAAGNLTIAMSNLAMYSTLLSVPILLERRGISAITVGVLLASLSATNIVASPIGGRLSDRYGRRLPVIGGMTVFTIALSPLAFAGSTVPIPLLVACLGSAGIGLGLGWAGLQTAVVESVEPKDTGVASGIFSTGRYFGSIVGTSILAGFLGSGHHGHGNFTAIFIMVVAGASIASVASYALADRPTPPHSPP